MSQDDTRADKLGVVDYYLDCVRELLSVKEAREVERFGETGCHFLAVSQLTTDTNVFSQTLKGGKLNLGLLEEEI